MTDELGTGASAKADQALAVPVEPVSRLDPTGFDPSRIIELAVAIAAELGDDFDTIPYDKPEWIRTRGGTPFRDVNQPFQKDYLAAASAAFKLGCNPKRYTDSLMVPETLPELLGEFARFECDYDLREYIDGLAENPGDGLIWRDCVDVANAIAMEARQGRNREAGSDPKDDSAGPEGIARTPAPITIRS